MKYFALLPLFVSLFGCSSSSDEPVSDIPVVTANPLVGKWVSNCHENFELEDGLGNGIRSQIVELTFTESEVMSDSDIYTDTNCTMDPVEESITFNYTVQEQVDTDDGTPATRLVMMATTSDDPELTMPFSIIFRITGVDLNFGDYIDGEVPSISIDRTFTKQ